MENKLEISEDLKWAEEELPLSTDRVLELLEKERKLHEAEIQLAAWEIFRRGLEGPDNPNRHLLPWCPPKTT